MAANSGDASKLIFKPFIKMAESKLDQERQQIEAAFKAGFKEGELEVQDYNPNYYNAEDYYQSKYTESKGE
ncbi:hypothetical protein [Sphingobacterium kyonggiense]